jgi:iron-sulfur cluster insertion protein
VLVDSMSMEYLRGASINYREDAMGANFVIENPNAQTSCGCGSSFNPY